MYLIVEYLEDRYNTNIIYISNSYKNATMYLSKLIDKMKKRYIYNKFIYGIDEYLICDKDNKVVSIYRIQECGKFDL